MPDGQTSTAQVVRHLALAVLVAIALALLGGCGGSDDADDPLAGAAQRSAQVVADSTATVSSSVVASETIERTSAMPTSNVVSSSTTITSGTPTSVTSTTATNPTSTSTTTTTSSTTSTTTSTTMPTSTMPTSTSTSTSTAAPPSGGGGCGAGTTHCVGPGQQYATLTAAVAAASDGAVIELITGTYNETVAVAADNVTIRSGAGGRATIDCSGLRPAQGKACILAVGTDLTVEDMVVTGARGPDNNEACFRNEPGTRYTVRRVECYGSNNGILGSGGSWLIEDSHFHDNGAGDGFSHNLYLSGDCSEVVFRRSRSERAVGGHAFKSRCRTSTIESSTLRDNAVADAAEFSYGGNVTIRDTTIHQPDGGNGNIVRHGAEGCLHSGALTFVNASISTDRSHGYLRSECQAIVLDNTPLSANITIAQP